MYEDFKINEKAIEEIAKQFETTKIMQSDNEEETENVSEKDELLLGVLSGMKILERLLFTAKNKTKNQKLLNFILTAEKVIETEQKNISGIAPKLDYSSLDFEYPQNDGEVIKMIQNILSSIIVEAPNIINKFEDLTVKKLVLNTTKNLAQILKDSLIL